MIPLSWAPSRPAAPQTPNSEGRHTGARPCRRPSFHFQQMDAPRPQRNRVHIDVWVPYDQAETCIAVAIAAGGRLVTDAHAPSHWVLAGPDGNEACVGTADWTGPEPARRQASTIGQQSAPASTGARLFSQAAVRGCGCPPTLLRVRRARRNDVCSARTGRTTSPASQRVKVTLLSFRAPQLEPVTWTYTLLMLPPQSTQ
ncbi:VOC family protein [Streptomyces sp. NPDC059680]|uniref:VOC family protein n=1 Tax=Streptomyces TaxID=1883 RepID=UPI001E3FEBED|nr:VOC family protein [Streptomyces barringtoniae]MCC5474594.1 hypothetical protein [Streptomyces barringtoniae]